MQIYEIEGHMQECREKVEKADGYELYSIT
mgnify:CR=1 FL=1